MKTGQSQGCDPSTEAVLRLKEKQVQECLDVRRRHDHEVAWRMIYACLWKFRSLPLIHDVETWFTAPSIDMTNGCNKLRTLKIVDLSVLINLHYNRCNYCSNTFY